MPDYDTRHLEGDYCPKRVQRRDQRMFRRQYGKGLAVYEAHTNGEALAYYGHAYRNPYPPGKRHDAFERAYNMDRGNKGNDQ